MPASTRRAEKHLSSDRHRIRWRALAAGILLGLSCSGVLLADDTEIFVGQQSGVRPNIVFILDTSGSMESEVRTREPYNPATTYAGACQANRVYWRRDTGAAPDCTTNNWFDAAQLKCAAALQAFAVAGNYIADRAAQWNPGSGQLRWENIRNSVKNQPVECRADAGVHGETAGDPKVFAFNSGVAGESWTADSSNQIGWNTNNADRRYTLYSANWLNWFNDSANLVSRTRLQVVQEVATNLVNSISGVNIGLMRYSNNGGNGDAQAEGGMVTFPVSPVESSRGPLSDSIESNTAAGFTPLSETLFEAQQYFAGRQVVYGLNSQISPGNPLPSVPASRRANDPSFYRSPAELSCQKNFVVYLTDGEPTQDNSADGSIVALPEFSSLVGSDCDGSGPGRCLDDLAEYMNDADLRPDVPGRQNVVTYTIGFGPDVAGSSFLQTVAQRGGGSAFTADDSATLTTVLTNIVSEILQTSSTFVSPSVAVNAFNRTETLSDLYISLFEPANTYHWPGNVKKFRLNDGVVVDADGEAAIDDQTGFFRGGARSLWSGISDGGSVSAGGAAARLPAVPSQRRLFTFLGDASLNATTNRVSESNGALSDQLLGLGAPGQPTRRQLLDWAQGTDVRDDDQDGDTTEARRQMGDPLHGRPAVVVYGGTQAAPDIDDAVVFTPTNDGYLHALDARSGEELWAFIPPELLDRLADLYQDSPQSSKHYGLDGDIRVFKIDRNQDGVVDSAAGDRVLLYFGMRRGGNNYYALDVTSKTNPVHLWTLGPGQLPGVGQTWSTPALTRVAVSGASQNADQLALVFGGGYDETQDNDRGATLYNTDTLGNRIFIVDAIRGTLLWFAGGPGLGTPNLSLAGMNNSIPAPVRVIDFDGDGFMDRMYAADTGGRVWRFDVITDSDATAPGLQTPSADNLVTGGVFASLGNADLATHPLASTRRFYQPPDVALVQRRGARAYFSVALGSGWRAHPLNTQIQDRFYGLRDYQPFIKLTQPDYDGRTPLADGDLIDITDNVRPLVPNGAAGWKLELRLPGGFDGEKVLAESRTFNNIIFFPTYLPNAGAAADPCTPAGNNRAYAVSIDDGRPVIDINHDGRTTLEDRYTRLAQGGIAPEISFLFPGRSDTPGGNNLPPGQRPLLCSAGVEILKGLCVNAGTPVRTYWRQSGTQ